MAGAIPVLGSGLFGIAGKVASSLIGKPAEPVATPAPTPVMPLADDAKVAAARKRQIAAALQRGGRSSTILTNNSDSLGG